MENKYGNTSVEDIQALRQARSAIAKLNTMLETENEETDPVEYQQIDFTLTIAHHVMRKMVTNLHHDLDE